MKTFLLFLVLGMTSLPMIAQPTGWKVDTYTVSFEITNAGLPVDGTFTGLRYKLNFDSDQLSASKLLATVDVKTIDTGISGRDDHLRSEDYFDVEQFPTIRMETKQIRKGTEKPYEASMALTIKGKTEYIEVPFTFDASGSTAKLEGSFNIDRRTFEVGGNSLIMGDNVEVTIMMELEKK